jgi:prepilin-type processing-associated H-X9-DG protein
MRHNWLQWRLVLVLLACAGTAPRASFAEDMATVLPAETAVYIGWARQVTPGDPKMRLEEQIADAALRLVQAKAENAEDAALAQALMRGITGLQKGSVGIGLFDVRVVDQQPDVQAALVAALDADPPALLAVVRQLVARGCDEKDIVKRTVRGQPFEVAPLGDAPLKLAWGQYKDYGVVALGEPALDKVLDAIDHSVVTLAETAELQFLRKQLDADVTGKHVAVYANVERIIGRAVELARELSGGLPAQVEPLLQETGLRSLRGKYVQLDELGGTPRLRAFAHVNGPAKGILKAFDQPPLTDADLQIVPQNAYWAQVGNLDLAGLWNEARRIVEAVAPDQMPSLDGALAMVTGVTGFSIQDELLPALGDTWAVFDAPAHGGLLLTGTVLCVEVKDEARLQRILGRLIEMATPLARQKEITLLHETTTHAGHEIHYVLVGGVPSPLAPAWAFADHRVVFGLWPQTVAAALKQIEPQTRGPSIPDQPDVQAARAQLPRGFNGFGYLDSRYVGRLLYPVLNALQTIGVSMIGPHGAKLDLQTFPPVDEHLAKTQNFVSGINHETDGIRYTAIGDGSSVLTSVAVASLTTSVLLPSMARAREIAKRAVSASNLRGIGQGVLIYANDHGDKFPPDLRALVAGGMVTEQMLQSPRDPVDEANSYTYIAGQKMGDDPRNVLAYERFQGDEGTNLLFLDGHVEWQKLDEARRMIRATYQRLQREAEIPEDVRE